MRRMKLAALVVLGGTLLALGQCGYLLADFALRALLYPLASDLLYPQAA